MAANFKETIASILEPLANAAAEPIGLKVVRLVVRGSEQTPVIEIIIDGEKAVTLDNCATVSRHINEAVEEGTLIKGNFRLDVMSPGAEEPLKELYQYKRNIGRLIKIQTNAEPEERTIVGRLSAMEGSNLILEVKPVKGARVEKGMTKETLSLSKIKSAVVQIEFNPRSAEDENF